MAKRGNPNWTKGTSGNPSGKKLEHRDGWSNTASGHGTALDRRMLTRFGVDIVTDLEAKQLWRSEWLCRRIIEVLPGEANRRGWDLKLDDKDRAAVIHGRAEEIDVDGAMTRAAEFERAYGGSAIYPAMTGALGALAQPLEETRIQKINALHVFEPQELWPSSYYSDLNHPKFGHPETYRFMPLTSGRTGYIAYQVVHESRLIIFPGKRVSRQTQPGQREGWGDSELNHARQMISDAGLTWGSMATLLHEFGQGVYEIDGLGEMLGQKDGIEQLQKRMQAMDMFKSTMRSTAIDAKDRYSRQATPASGLDGLLVQQMQWIAAVAGMPVTKLFGMSPAGLNATGEMDVRNWYADVEKVDSCHYGPRRERLVKLLLLEGGQEEPESWSVDPRPLWTPSEKEIAETQLIIATTDEKNITNGVYSADDAAKRYSDGKFVTIDFAAREAQKAEEDRLAEEARDAEIEAAKNPPVPEATAANENEPQPEGVAAAAETHPPKQEPPPPTPPAEPVALNGAQVTSLVDVVKAAVGGEIPRESAQQMIQLAFNVDPATAVKLLGPAGFKPKVEEAAPREDENAADRYAALIRKLSPDGKCDGCGEVRADLEVDHVGGGRSWDPAALSKAQRTQKYADEHEAGVKLRALCRSCNASDGAKRQHEAK